MNTNEPPPIHSSHSVSPPVISASSEPTTTPARKPTSMTLVILLIICFFLLTGLILVEGGYFLFQKIKNKIQFTTSQEVSMDQGGLDPAQAGVRGETAKPGETPALDPMAQMLLTQVMNQTVKQLLDSNPNVERVSTNDLNVIKFRNKKTGKTGELNLRLFLQKQDPNVLMNEELMAVFDESGNIESSGATPSEATTVEPSPSPVPQSQQELPAVE